MKKSLMSMLLIFAASCVQESVALKHVSQIDARTRGISFVDDQSVDTGMAGNTCRFDIRTGVIVTDQDIVQGEEDAVTDAYDGDTVIVSKSGGFVMNENFENTNLVHLFPGENVTDARFTSDGVLALIDDNNNCQIGWHTSDTESTAQIGGACPSTEQFDVSRDLATAYAASIEGVTAYTQSESEIIAPPAVMLKWDDASQALYTTHDGRDITAYNANGTVRWSAEMSGRITSFDDMGTSSAVMAMVETNGAGELIILDAASGQVKKTFPTPTAAPKIIVSGNGRTLAVVLESETHFFVINSDF